MLGVIADGLLEVGSNTSDMALHLSAQCTTPKSTADVYIWVRVARSWSPPPPHPHGMVPPIPHNTGSNSSSASTSTT